MHGLLAIGDAACTTNPAGARGLSLGMLSAAALADIVTGNPPQTWTAKMDAWCVANLQPWFEDHLLWDASLRQRWAGEPIDPEGPIAWDLIAAAARERPELMSGLGPYLAMRALPATLGPLRKPVRQMLRDGWRPPSPPGPTRDDLVRAVRAHQAIVDLTAQSPLEAGPALDQPHQRPDDSNSRRRPQPRRRRESAMATGQVDRFTGVRA